VDQDIFALAEQSFGVRKHRHKRIVRSGPNTVCIFAENPPVRAIAEDDTVFLGLGPVFDEWEADVGRTYVMGGDPDASGQTKHWIIEVHLVDRARTFGGFYERLLQPADMAVA
jgi:Xaa-Pro aminopeptidase